jgi:hypothetical protein
MLSLIDKSKNHWIRNVELFNIIKITLLKKVALFSISLMTAYLVVKSVTLI